MIRVVRGDIFESGADAIVNTVNCVGVMGKGIALAYKLRYPEMFAAYQQRCRKGLMKVGQVWIWPNPVPPPVYIINFPTKDDWRNPSKLSWIEDGLADLLEYSMINEIASLALPALGCTNGGLAFTDVRRAIEDGLKDLDGVEITLYEPQ